ncbi:ShlB/FhaC/HecB family hemolysin secretion/activation protein [Microvirga massiliensis]|uniref:ShlB/FhaC/HecB family hemolysin secretion/activation protein n=1 Tax=Microvirga massiliensis TaxID=1033741 RepID=UPI0009E2AEA6|nr:ShlB/FhaC/HecB family hemolysin secretion/activation protein [Microvirga massiliensis]
MQQQRHVRRARWQVARDCHGSHGLGLEKASTRRRLAALVLTVLLPGAAFSQTASQITPPSFRPGTPQAGGAIVFSGRPGLDAPPGADRLTVRLKGITVEGPLPALAAVHRALEQRLVGQPIKASELFAAVRDLEAAYTRAGYVLVRVVLPAQTLKDGGTLRIVVINGYIERVEAAGVPEMIRPRVLAVVTPLVGQRGLTLAQIERRLLLAGDTPGTALTSTLKRGEGAAGTILVVEAKHRPVSGFVGADNTLASALGRSVINTGLDLNSVLGVGETIYLRAYGHPGGDDFRGFGGLFTDRPRVRTLAAGTVVPIGVDGLTFNIEGTQSKTTPKPLSFQTASVFERLSLRLRYPWVRSRQLNVGSELIFDAQTEDFSLPLPGLDIPLSSDRLRIARLAGDISYLLPANGIVAARAIASFGLDGLGARSAAEANIFNPLSRLGADADFQKFEAIASITQPVAEHLAFAAYARGQTSFNQALARSEQIGIASFNELSTFDAGTLGGDSGWVVRAEVSSPWTISGLAVPVTVAPYAYAATGALYLQRPTVLEQGITYVSSLAVGLRFGATIDPNFSDAYLALEFGRAFRDDNEPDANRFTFVGSIRF